MERVHPGRHPFGLKTSLACGAVLALLVGGCARSAAPGVLRYEADAPPAPPFAATSHDGRHFTLHSLTEDGPLVLVFLRDLACPFARGQLRQLRDHYRRFVATHATIAVVVHDTPRRVARRWARYHLPFVGIPDPSGRLAKAYRQPWRVLELGRMPSLFIIDHRARLVVSQRGRSMADIPDERAVLRAVHQVVQRSAR